MMSQVDDNEMDTRFEVGSTVFAYVDIRPRMAEDFPKTSRDELPWDVGSGNNVNF